MLPPPNVPASVPSPPIVQGGQASATPISDLAQTTTDAATAVVPSTVSPNKGSGAGDAFWGDDPSILFDKMRLVEFFPTLDQTLPERMNAITRLIIYVSIALSLYQGKSTAVHFGILLMAMLYFMWRSQTVEQIGGASDARSLKEGFSGSCTMPTPQNPYMNWLPGDDPTKPPACSGPGVQEQAAALLDEQLFSDVDDLFSKNANQRQFRTMPNTEVVSNNEKFINWLIKNDKNCKTDKCCAPFEDLRLQKQLIPEDLDKEFNVTGFSL